VDAGTDPRDLVAIAEGRPELDHSMHEAIADLIVYREDLETTEFWIAFSNGVGAYLLEHHGLNTNPR